MAHPDEATWRKVGVREGDRLALVRAPATWSAEHSGAGSVVRRLSGRSDVVVAFFGSLAALEAAAPRLAAGITPSGMAWVAWPRKAAGHDSDLSDHSVRAALLAQGLVDVKVAMLDEDWSGLKFVWRRELRGPQR